MRRLDKIIAYLAMYAHQDMPSLQHEPTVVLMGWCQRVAEFKQQEREEIESRR